MPGTLLTAGLVLLAAVLFTVLFTTARRALRRASARIDTILREELEPSA